MHNGRVKRALPLLAVLSLAACGSSHHARLKPKPPGAPVLSDLLAHRHSVHFALDGTVKIDEQSLLSHLHQLPPFGIHGSGDASRYGLNATGNLSGEVSGRGTAVVAGPKAYARAGSPWYSLGKVKPIADLLRSANWTVDWDTAGQPRSVHGDLHVSTGQLEQLSGLSLPFGVDGADLSITIHLSRWGEPVHITRPRGASPLPHG
jgi:hypothetical protein